MVLYLAIFLIIVALDQISKYITAALLTDGKAITVIEGILDFTFVQNEGAAFGILKGARIFFIVMTIAVTLLAVWYLKKEKPASHLEKTAITFIGAGAAGNFIDRLFLGYVRDFICVRFIDFPVFNIADCFVCIGAGLYILFTLISLPDGKHKEEKTDE